MDNKVYHKLKNAEYYIVDLTATGKVRDNDVDVMKLLQHELETGDYTDVVIVSHGWNTDRTEQGSIELPDQVVEQMQKRKFDGVKPLYVAIKWPSVPMTLFEGEALTTTRGFLKLVRQIRQLIKSESRPFSLLNAAREIIVDPVDEAAEKLQELGKKFLRGGEDEKLPEELAENIAVLANALDEQSEEKPTRSVITTAVVESKYQQYRVKDQQSSDAPSVVVARRVLPTVSRLRRAYDLSSTLFDIFFSTFERRAGVVGKNGVHKLLKKLMRTAKNDVRFHMYGHSLGAHVVLSGAIGEGKKLPRKIHAVMLAQGCLPKNVLAKNGLYRQVADGLKPIGGPILATVFWKDEALIGYDVWMPSPVGRVGFDKASLMKVDSKVIEALEEGEPRQPVEFKAGTCYNLAAGAVVRSHTDVKDKEIMDMFWKAAAVQF